MTAPSPHKLWVKAHEEHPDKPAQARVRYIELMIEHAHILPQAKEKTASWLLRELLQTAIHPNPVNPGLAHMGAANQITRIIETLSDPANAWILVHLNHRLKLLDV